MPDRFAGRLLLVTLAAIAVVLAAEFAPILRSALLVGSVEPRVVTPRGELAPDESTTIALFEAAKDSVVSITTAERVVDSWTRNAYDVPRGTGSGFVWDEAGHVVTNAHVIEGAASAMVRLADGRAFRASLAGVDPGNDLAVLRIDAGRVLPPLAVGSSADLRVGQSVFAIGNPFGLDWTMTTGIISALDRELPNSRGGLLAGLIQTDAAINPGNSGGPLVDSAGRLVGVNTAIYSPSGSSAGIGFAVPVDTVNRVVPQLIARGRYDPPTIGVTVDARADEITERLGEPGAMILGLERGSPAARAGLRAARITPEGVLIPGDIVVALDGEPVRSAGDLRAGLDRRRAGEEVRLTVSREGDRSEVTVMLEQG